MQKVYPKFYGKIVQLDGHRKFLPDNSEYYRKYMDNNTKPGQRWTFALLPYRKPRTTGSAADFGEGKGNQNGYYWKIVLPILAEYFGLELWQMHEEIKLKFLPVVSKLDPNKVIPGTTQKLDRVQWEDFMQRIRIWALTEYEIKIPKPNEAVDEDGEDYDDGEVETPKKAKKSKVSKPTPKKKQSKKKAKKPAKEPKVEIVDALNPLIEMFKDVNPSYFRIYPNKTQRAALQRLLNQHGLEKLTRVIRYLPKSNMAKFAPVITTPLQLEADLGKLIAWAAKQKADTKKVADLGKK